jgi:3-hydroxyacyl-[acyl-carrier-protein] dehydratase
MSANTTIDINKILKLLPHRYPFLLVDRVIEITPKVSITALKNVTMNEPLTFSEERPEGSIYYFAGIDGARFKKPVLPGDQLIMTAKVERGRAGIYKFAVQATVDGELAAEANITCAVRNRGE